MKKQFKVMFIFIKAFTVLLSFSGSSARIAMSLNNDSCLARPTLIDLNSNELHNYSFMVSLDRCNGS